MARKYKKRIILKSKRALQGRIWRSKNRESNNKKNRDWYHKNKERAKKINKKCILKKLYSLTVQDYERMFLLQNGCCAICSVHQSKLKKPLSVDHCHTTGEVRGLLCHHCNTGIGNLKDDAKILRKAIKYLNKTKIKKQKNPCQLSLIAS